VCYLFIYLFGIVALSYQGATNLKSVYVKIYINTCDLFTEKIACMDKL